MRMLESFFYVCLTAAIAGSGVALFVAQCWLAGGFRWFLVLFFLIALLSVGLFGGALAEWRQEVREWRKSTPKRQGKGGINTPVDTLRR